MVFNLALYEREGVAVVALTTKYKYSWRRQKKVHQLGHNIGAGVDGIIISPGSFPLHPLLRTIRDSFHEWGGVKKSTLGPSRADTPIPITL